MHIGEQARQYASGCAGLRHNFGANAVVLEDYRSFCPAWTEPQSCSLPGHPSVLRWDLLGHSWLHCDYRRGPANSSAVLLSSCGRSVRLPLDSRSVDHGSVWLPQSSPSVLLELSRSPAWDLLDHSWLHCDYRRGPAKSVAVLLLSCGHSVWLPLNSRSAYRGSCLVTTKLAVCPASLLQPPWSLPLRHQSGCRQWPANSSAVLLLSCGRSVLLPLASRSADHGSVWLPQSSPSVLLGDGNNHVYCRFGTSLAAAAAPPRLRKIPAKVITLA